MPESSIFWTAPSIGDGASTYTQTQLFDWLRRTLIGRSAATEGVLAGYANELAVTGTATPVSINTGAAVVYGVPYENTTSVTVAIPTPSAGNSRYDRIVLRALWSTATVRITRIAGVESGSPAIPALIQTANSTWDMPLTTILVNASGVITQADARAFAHFNTKVSSAMVDPGVALANIGYTPVNKAGDTMTGNLGIQTSALYSQLLMGNDVDATGAALFRNNSTNNGYAGNGSLNLFTLGVQAIGLVTNNLLRVIVTAAGRVGIGTATPTTALDVQGGQVTVNPASAQPPFVLGAFAQGQLVAGLNAATVGGVSVSQNTNTIIVGLYRLQWGTTTATISGGSTLSSVVTVAMPFGYSSPPFVFTTNDSSIAHPVTAITASAISGSSLSFFAIAAASIGSSRTFNINWFAVGLA